MQDLTAVLDFLLPWEFSPSALALCAGMVVLYLYGVRRMDDAERPGFGRRIAFVSGWALIYFVMQTRWDYYSQHMFFMHRIQHLVLHHLGPFLVLLAQPLPVLARGLPAGVISGVLRPFWRNPVTRIVYGVLQHWLVAPLLFVGLICFWLVPTIHFYAMLSDPLYLAMNWSMLLDGLLFWGLMLDPRSRQEGATTGFGQRIFLLLFAVLPQIFVGAHIGLANYDIYKVYAVCGRAWPINPLTDQQLGGLIIWIPAGMMHVIGVLVLLARWMRSDQGTNLVSTALTAR